ncbi:MAG: hypothetical protein Kow0029_09230 [Candidatus Rifleibacteriota bacterium]
MKARELTNTCKNTIEQIIDGKELTEESKAHTSSCKSCQLVISTTKEIVENGEPANFSDLYPDLKQKVMKRLVPVMNQKFKAQKPTSIFSEHFFRFVFAGAAIILAFIAIVPKVHRPLPEKKTYLSSDAINSAQVFEISVNGNTAIKSSLDNPVSLFANETAEITIPDGSSLKVRGPARLAICPRGFHLIEGSLTAKVARGNTKFTGTTPHGKIEVLGTVFSCESTAQKTVVKVIEGKVKVIPDIGTAVTLTAGESTEMMTSDAVSSDSETIPSIDSE